MLQALAAEAAQATEEVHGHLPMPPLAFAIVAACVLTAMLISTMAFRSVGTRH